MGLLKHHFSLLLIAGVHANQYIVPDHACGLTDIVNGFVTKVYLAIMPIGYYSHYLQRIDVNRSAWLITRYLVKIYCHIIY